MKLSKFGEKFSKPSGITNLMEDLNHGLTSGEDIIMMGGGNPSHIPAVQTIFRQRLKDLADDSQLFQQLIGIYDSPQGDHAFIDALARLLKSEFGWNISAKNIALCNGSQSAFFILFNLFAGEFSDGTKKTIHFPLCPEYIGYSDIGLCESFFSASKPLIDLLPNQQFKYRINLNELPLDGSIGALCLSRPTNPSGNVITDSELKQLQTKAKLQGIPLIIDSAYGCPFPNIVFPDATPMWDDNTILSMSLSKLGLPTARTGIIIANEDVIKAVTEANAVLSLSTGSFGSMLAQELIETGEILSISDNLIKPFYQQKADFAAEVVSNHFNNLPYRMHKPEGAMFLWFWFEDLPISSQELYERLKQRGVYVIAGHHFFPGFDEPWRHTDECIRVTYTQSEENIERGLRIIAEEVKKAFS